MNSELIHRSHSGQTPQPINLESPKPTDPLQNSKNPLLYMLREQRLLFMFAGIAIATLFFNFLPPHDDHHLVPIQSEPSSTRRALYDQANHYNPVLGLGLGSNSGT
ncbi:hypothetical protein SLA2020_430990 [Shorea laevis]